MAELEQDFEYNLDASIFQKPLGDIAEVIAQKVKREGPALLPTRPVFVATDLHVLIRLAMRTHDLLFYINADERRETDCYWRPVYTMVSLPLIRNMIDCLYNITFILQDPAANGAWFRKSGFKKALNALDEDEKRYGGQPKWDNWIQKNREGFDLGIRESGLTTSEVLAQARDCPTLGKYICDKQTGGALVPIRIFLRLSLLASGASARLWLTQHLKDFSLSPCTTLPIRSRMKTDPSWTGPIQRFSLCTCCAPQRFC